jgi:hypothetical protein
MILDYPDKPGNDFYGRIVTFYGLIITLWRQIPIGFTVIISTNLQMILKYYA